MEYFVTGPLPEICNDASQKGVSSERDSAGYVGKKDDSVRLRGLEMDAIWTKSADVICMTLKDRGTVKNPHLKPAEDVKDTVSSLAVLHRDLGCSCCYPS